METNPQRATALKLAESLGATQTVALLRSDDHRDVAAVMKLALSEVGREKFSEAVIGGHPGWAGDALRFIDDLGDQRAALAAAAGAADVVACAAPAADAGATAGQPVGQLELYLAAGAAMEAWFTMFWINNGAGYPQTTTTDQGKWLWSRELSIAINRSATIACPDFASQIGAPLNPGDSVWMVQNSCSTNHDTGFRFVYQPGGPLVRINVVGGAANPSFSIYSGD